MVRAVGDIGGGAVFLVVIGFGHRRAPVHHEAPVVLVGDARIADVELFGGIARLELQDDLAK